MWTFEEWRLFWKMLNSMPEFRCGERPIAEPEVFSGLSNGARTDAIMAEVYDAEFADMIADRMAEKCMMRNRRKCERKARVKNPRYIKRNGGNWSKSVHYQGDKSLHYEESLRMPETRANKREQSLRKDWELEAEAIAEDAEAEWLRNYIIAEYERIETERKQEEENRNLREWLKYA